MFADSLRWQQDIKMNSVLNSYAPATASGFSQTYTSGNIATWGKGAIEGGSKFDAMTGLMNRQQVSFNIEQHYGKFTFLVGFSASKYALPVDGRLDMLGMGAVQNQFSIGGAISYCFNSYMSATIYGQYVSNPFFYSMAAFPYISTSSYGGYLTFHNNKVGIDLGVNNHYDPFARRWQTDPIIRPSFKIGKIKTDIDLGPLMKEGMLKIMGKKRRQGPIIMPDM